MRVRGVALCMALLAAILIAGCGSEGDGSDNSNLSPSYNIPGTTGASAVVKKKLSIAMGEFYLRPSENVAAAGKVTISAPNEGKMKHELVLLRTNQDPGQLKVDKNGEVVEGAYQSPGEIADVSPGATKKVTLDLKPGKYAIVCNLPGHYKAGMYGSLTIVKPSASVETTTTTRSTSTLAKKLSIDMGEFFFKPKDNAMAVGKVAIAAPNIGKTPHEFVVLRTNQDPGQLKVDKKGEVVEGAYKSPGEIPDVAPGSTKKVNLKLEAGKYAIVCNLPGHYKAGMYASLTAK